jgi:glycosyltransferase involved in cell wall biosynthesis
VIGYFEFYFRTHGADIGFDPEFPVTLDDRCQVHTRNMTHLLSWQACDWGWSPTAWQAGLFPGECRRRISVIHDGIDTRRLRGHAGARFRLPGGKELTRDDEVLTLVNRNMEPYRGFHVFMRALPEIQRRRPHAHTLVIGAENDVSYGNPPANGKTWRQQLLEEVGDRLDLARVHFLGQLAFERYIEVLQVSRAHVYMTYPYILSWSILEAMACECLVIGSNTPPVAEVIRHGQNGLLFDFFDQKALVETACDVLADTSRYDTLRRCARQTVTEGYELNSVCIPQQLELVRGVSRSGC